MLPINVLSPARDGRNLVGVPCPTREVEPRRDNSLGLLAEHEAVQVLGTVVAGLDGEQGSGTGGGVGDLAGEGRGARAYTVPNTPFCTHLKAARTLWSTEERRAIRGKSSEPRRGSPWRRPKINRDCHDGRRPVRHVGCLPTRMGFHQAKVQWAAPRLGYDFLFMRSIHRLFRGLLLCSIGATTACSLASDFPEEKIPASSGEAGADGTVGESDAKPEAAHGDAVSDVAQTNERQSTVCTSTCANHAECESTCPVSEFGSNCCDTAVGVCYVSGGAACPGDPLPDGSTADGNVSDGGASDSRADAAPADSASADSGSADSGSDALVDFVTGFAYAPTVWSPGAMGQYAVHSTGQLTPLAPPTVAIGNTPSALAATPDSKFLYVTDSLADNIQQFAIASDGTVAPLAPASIATSAYPAGIAVHPSGKFAYVTSGDKDLVTRYAIQKDADAGVPGTLTLIDTTAVGSSPYGIAITPSGNALYVVNGLSDTISQFSIDANGALSPLSPATVSVAPLPGRIVVSADGAFAYLTHFDPFVSQFSIDQGGGLLALSPPKEACEDTPTHVAVNHAGTLAFVTNTSAATISQYSVSSGFLTPLAAATVSIRNDAGSGVAHDVALDPTGTFVFVANGTQNVIHQFSMTPEGLVPLVPFTTASSPGGGRLLVVAKP